MQEGKYVGKLIKARLAGAPAPPPFKYFDKGTMATIGHKAAVADAFGMKFTGFIAYIMWGFIHVLYLVGWGNRLGTLYTWARAIWFSNNRGHRIITFETSRANSRRVAPSQVGRAITFLVPLRPRQPGDQFAPQRRPHRMSRRSLHSGLTRLGLPTEPGHF